MNENVFVQYVLVVSKNEERGSQTKKESDRQRFPEERSQGDIRLACVSCGVVMLARPSHV